MLHNDKLTIVMEGQRAKIMGLKGCSVATVNEWRYKVLENARKLWPQHQKTLGIESTLTASGAWIEVIETFNGAEYEV
jgi:hypothetical protein